MDLQNKIKRGNSSENPSPAPFRQSGADRSNYGQSTYRHRNPNRQAPRSVQYQPETDDIHSSYNDFLNEQQSEAYLENTNGANPQQPILQQNAFGQQFVPVDGTVPATPVIPNFTTPPQFAQQNPYQNQTITTPPQVADIPVQKSDIPQSELDATEKNFFDAIESLFDRYEIDKVLIVDNRIYTVNFTGDENQEIFDETINKDLLDKFVKYFVCDGYFEALLNNGCKLEMTYKPVSEHPTIIASKTHSDFYVDEEFVSILFEFLSKGKNMVMLSNFAIDTMYKVVSDFFTNNLCITINEPMKTENNISFRENPIKPSLKTVYSISKKIEPDNTLVYTPSDLRSTISYMKKNSGVVLFSETDSPSDFINADAIHSLGGQSEYNRISILKAVDIIFTIVQTKNGTIKYTATQLLSPTNKSHVNKIKKIVGDAEIDINKIYFNNVFEKEV